MLLNCLETETSSFNLRYLLHLIEVYVFEDVAFCPGLVGVVVKTIQEKVPTRTCYFQLCFGIVKEYLSDFSPSCTFTFMLLDHEHSGSC